MPAIPSLRSGGPHAPRPRVPIPPARAVVDCAVYVDGVRQSGRRGYAEALNEVRTSGQGFVWVGLHAPDDRQMEGVAETFELHELMVEDAVHAHQRPKLERYDDTQFIVLRTVNYVEHESLTAAKEVVETGEIMIFVGRDFVITVRHGDFTHLAGVRSELEKRPDRLALGPYAVMHAIADHVVDTYLDVVAAVENDVDTLEESIFSPGRAVDIEPVYLLKREITELRRAVAPLTTPLQRLTSPQNNLCPKEVRRYLRDVADHHTNAAEQIATFDEVLTSLLEAASAKIGIQQNTDMRKITAWVAIASVPTMVAGIYGMNFDNIPELHWKYGYFMVLAFLALVCTGLWRTFRRNNWL
ncbi:magnesium and cobalt transport protein CorA [Williamsia sp. CHRR-6]|uniref:magnesium and cobalt transport protein CorA n=1 Tax=Williamsia sp. CHRR-6 TaxID=2835871 RepID=UPI001BD9BA17|nr:magnesium and cobalt transport protein CorA [Williamsia sp. CHRR-6]MBT0568457.1 magnesium and cobalt transport protein CorA [Williamsia sp. CHRR-6]